MRRMSLAERRHLARVLAELDGAGEDGPEDPDPAGRPGHAGQPLPDRPQAAPSAPAGAARLRRLLRGPGGLDRGPRRHVAAPFRRPPLACRLGELRRVPARGLRRDGLGHLAGTAGADPPAGGHRHHAVLRRVVRRRHLAGHQRPVDQPPVRASSPSCRWPSWPSPGRASCSGPRSTPASGSRPRRPHGRWKPPRPAPAAPSTTRPARCAARRCPGTAWTRPSRTAARSGPPSTTPEAAERSSPG